MRYLYVLFITLFAFGCADNSGSGKDATSDSIGDTITIEVPIDPILPDPTSDTDPIPIEIPVNELLTKINITGSTLALKPREVQLNNYRFMSINSNVIGGDCDELGTLNGDIYEELEIEGSTACFSDVEIFADGRIYAKYYFQDQSQVESLKNIQDQVTFSIITDSEGNVHYLPGHPIKKNSFKNSKLIQTYQDKPVYINSDSKLVMFDISSDSESIIINEDITNFSIKDYSDGSHFVIDGTSDVKRINPDNSEEILSEIQKGNWHDIEGSIQYVSQNKFKRMLFDVDGNITDRTAYSYPEEFNFWLINGVQTNGSTALPQGIPFYGSVTGCSKNTVGNQIIMICNEKAFMVRGILEDLEEINWCDYGHCGILTWLTIKSCATNNYLFFYAQDTLSRNRLTWINDSTKEFRDILDTHQITDLECISDSEIAVIGIIGESTETLSIIEADTIVPIITVIDSYITDVITQ